MLSKPYKCKLGGDGRKGQRHINEAMLISCEVTACVGGSTG